MLVKTLYMKMLPLKHCHSVQHTKDCSIWLDSIILTCFKTNCLQYWKLSDLLSSSISMLMQGSVRNIIAIPYLGCAMFRNLKFSTCLAFLYSYTLSLSFSLSFPPLPPAFHLSLTGLDLAEFEGGESKVTTLISAAADLENTSLLVFVLPTQNTPGAAGEPLVALVAYNV
jgi:hypothetical protein